MSNEDRERRRVERLRADQIRSRDPGPSKIKDYDWSKQRARPKRSLLATFNDGLNARMRGMIYGVLLGVILAVIITFTSPGSAAVGLALILFAGIIGWVLGAVVQS